jgi:hypothetical protein
MYGFASTVGLSIGLGLIAQLARVLLTEVGHGMCHRDEPDERDVRIELQPRSTRSPLPAETNLGRYPATGATSTSAHRPSLRRPRLAAATAVALQRNRFQVGQELRLEPREPGVDVLT